MKKKNIKLQFWPKRVFYLSFSALFLTGIFWLGIHLIADPRSNWVSESLHVMMQIHGAFAMVALLFLGWLIPSHIQLGWLEKRNQKTGIGMVIFCGLLIGSGYGLYYFGNENLRSATSILHILAGCLFPLYLGWHIRVGLRYRS